MVVIKFEKICDVSQNSVDHIIYCLRCFTGIKFARAETNVLDKPFQIHIYNLLTDFFLYC